MSHSGITAQRVALLCVISAMLWPSPAPAAPEDLLVPVAVQASSSIAESDTNQFHVVGLLDGAARFNHTSGANCPRGLLGYSSTPAPTNSAGLPFFPAHYNYKQPDYIEGCLPEDGTAKSYTMWTSASHDNTEAWIEFELAAFLDLEQIWIWNFNDQPEYNRYVTNLVIQTSSTDPGAGQFGSVTYNVSHGTVTFPGNLDSAARIPDVVFSFPPGTRTRYLRLANIHNRNPASEPIVGLSEVFIFAGPASGTLFRQQ